MTQLKLEIHHLLHLELMSPTSIDAPNHFRIYKNFVHR